MSSTCHTFSTSHVFELLRAPANQRPGNPPGKTRSNQNGYNHVARSFRESVTGTITQTKLWCADAVFVRSYRANNTEYTSKEDEHQEESRESLQDSKQTTHYEVWTLSSRFRERFWILRCKLRVYEFNEHHRQGGLTPPCWTAWLRASALSAGCGWRLLLQHVSHDHYEQCPPEAAAPGSVRPTCGLSSSFPRSQRDDPQAQSTQEVSSSPEILPQDCATSWRLVL
ncbi:hypothetical protein JOB18_030683 [Solea senegalensis]|uniref:Uncharacterized protein n=1 Tax=Solea senegalensis TaxID=28829 RepID=A0AAV6RWB8_SOLSE|nr:hypothetical protein JOB18_030683 [Solea senegalensis]